MADTEIMPHLVTYAAQLHLYRSEPISTDFWKDISINLLDDISNSCEARNVVIGHIKGFLKFEKNGYFYLSTISAQQGTSFRGDAAGTTVSAILDFNVLVYNIDKKSLIDLVLDGIENISNYDIKFIIKEANQKNHLQIKPR